MARTLHLQSPIMQGVDVTAVQKYLLGQNPWHKNFSPGRADSQYGKYTAAAVARAKHFLGYPAGKINTSCGDTLLAFLTGKKELPAAYKRLQKKRLKAGSKNKTMRAKALNSAMDKVGLKETPQGSNRNYLTKWWYQNDTRAAWCNISVSDSYIDAGSKRFTRGKDFAYVPYMENAAIHNDGMYRVGKDAVRPGDVVTMDFNGGEADHTGIFKEWVNKISGTFKCVEGNTDAAGGAEGGEQMIRVRTMDQVSQFIRVIK